MISEDFALDQQRFVRYSRLVANLFGMHARDGMTQTLSYLRPEVYTTDEELLRGLPVHHTSASIASATTTIALVAERVVALWMLSQIVCESRRERQTLERG